MFAHHIMATGKTSYGANANNYQLLAVLICWYESLWYAHFNLGLQSLVIFATRFSSLYKTRRGEKRWWDCSRW